MLADLGLECVSSYIKRFLCIYTLSFTRRSACYKRYNRNIAGVCKYFSLNSELNSTNSFARLRLEIFELTPKAIPVQLFLTSYRGQQLFGVRKGRKRVSILSTVSLASYFYIEPPPPQHTARKVLEGWTCPILDMIDYKFSFWTPSPRPTIEQMSRTLTSPFVACREPLLNLFSVSKKKQKILLNHKNHIKPAFSFFFHAYGMFNLYK